MIHTWSKIFYDFEVKPENSYLSFQETTGPERTATTRTGKYAPTKGLQRVANAMSDEGTQTYSIQLDRLTRLATISATNPFTLKVNTGSTAASSIFPLLGFTGADRTGTNIYTGNAPVASEYVPQFKVQDYIDPAHWKKSIDATVKKAADGSVEVVRFGVEQLMQLNFKWATDMKMDNGVIRNNPTGVADLVRLMDWLITKAEVEFMPDENNPNFYYTVLLDRSPQSATGTDYQIDEQYEKNLPGFFDTGRLVFRVTSL